MDMESTRRLADYAFIADEVKSFKKSNKYEATNDEMKDILQTAPNMTLVLTDAFVQQSAIGLELLDTTELFDTEEGELKKANIERISISFLVC